MLQHIVPVKAPEQRQRLRLVKAVGFSKGECITGSGALVRFIDQHLRPQSTAVAARLISIPARGKPLGLKFWRFKQLLSDTRISADGYRNEAFALPSHLQQTLWASVRYPI